ncbi:sensor histidine kinase [Phaeovulum sp.]|uniref:sensor histidine kinase n=1 Tax=Phaeovulum sp. TaxID=2934796 RepID=UPI0035649158
MRKYIAPGKLFAVAVMFSIALAVGLVWLATQQPWLGMQLGVGPQGEVRIERVAPGGSLPPQVAGARLLSLASFSATPSNLSAKPALWIEPNDLIEEPDTIGSPEFLRSFYTRQDQMIALLRGGPLALEIQREGQRETLIVLAKATRPLADLPMKLWMQLFVALTGGIVGAWVVCLRPRDGAAWMLMVAGLGLAMASSTAALYSARELALSAPVFTTASRINSTGSLLFGIGMVTLFLIYPRRIIPRPMLWLPTVVIGAAIAFIQLVEWPSHMGLLNEAIAATMAVLLAAIIAQVVVNRRDPRARAMLGWFGLSIGVGAGGFVLTSVVPTLLNLPPFLEQSTAFLFFLLIYVGIAMGVLRYRLFDLPKWSFGLLFYGVGAALLLVLDAALIYGLALDRAPALGIALATVGLVYLPMREAAARWLRRNRALPAEVLYLRITEIAHAMDPVQQQDLQVAFWADLFNPLKVTPITAGKPVATALQQDGASLTLSPVAGLPGLRLDWAQKGARLFSSADLARAKALNTMIERSLHQHQEYVEAVTSERLRINRDMHDNIGILLLGALHATTADRKDLLIRQTLTDLRDIISNPDQTSLPLPQLVADLRAEIVGYLEAADIDVRWHDNGLPNALLAPQIVRTLRSFLRESTSNIVRHSGARCVDIDLSASAEQLTVTLQDDGKGFDAASVRMGNGFRNLAARVAQLGGTFDLSSTSSGTRISTKLHLDRELEAAGADLDEHLQDRRAAE